MPVPKRRWSTHRQGKKRASLAIKLPRLVACPNCNKPALPHLVCRVCGYYKGKEIIKKTEKGKIKQKRKKEKKS